MKTIFFSLNMSMIDEWIERSKLEQSSSCSDLDSLESEIEGDKSSIVIADYDSVSHDINTLIASNTLPENTIILERSPEITTGKMLINHGVKAYGNSRMLRIHFTQMLETVNNGKVWSYPELTSALIKNTKDISLNEDAQELIEKRLTPKEIEVTHLILKGLTNSAVAEQLDITVRTVKAHVSAIFTKLHINDRVSLVLLLK